MPLTDTTNAVAVAPPAGADAAALKAKPTGSAAPNPEKLGIALDAVAGFDAAARDDATAKLEAAASKDAAGLCIALLGVASDAGCAPARRLAAATFTRNCLRKQWGARDAARDETTTNESARVTPEARADVRGASLRALVAAPPDTRRLLADCLRLAATDAVGWSASGPAGIDGAEVFVASGTGDFMTDRLASAAALVDDVVAVAERHETFCHDTFSSEASHTEAGLLLAAHVACVPFQYFRDATVAREEAHPAAETMSASLVAPKLVPALAVVAKRVASDANAARFARVAFKILFRLVRAHMPTAIKAMLPEVVGAIEATCVARAETAAKETEAPSSSGGDAELCWVAAKRALRLGAALVTRHADALDAGSIAKLARAGFAIAALPPGLAPTPCVAAAFASLRAALDGTRATREALFFCSVTSETDENPSRETLLASDKARRVALSDLVRLCVVPHVCLTEEDEVSLASDPEEYARANACGEAAEDDAVEDALDGNAAGVTSRRAALDFLEALARVPFDASAALAASGAKPTAPPPAKKARKGAADDKPEDEDDAPGSAKPTLGELAARDVVDEMLAVAPKEKVEKVGKAAGAAGATVAHAAPAAEAALGASAYFGVLRVSGALMAASRRAKESATRSFCRKHAFPAVAAAASPHVVVAAAAHCADVATKVTTAAVAREAFAALVAALERPTPAPSDEMDEEETEEAWRVTRDAASWAARAVVSEAPCAEEAFGEATFFESLAERLVKRTEASPARGAAPLRALAALAEAAAGAVAPAVAAALAARVAAAYAAMLRRDDADAEAENEADDDKTAEDDTTLDAWETSVEAVAALCEAAETWEAPEEDERKTLRRDALVSLAATAAAHVRAYWEAAAALEPPCADLDDADGAEEAPPAHPATAPMLRFACETLAETVEGGDAVAAAAASVVWSAAGAWASHLPAWHASDGDDILDVTALDALTAIVGAAVEAKAGESAIAAIAAPAARAAAAALAEIEDADARLAAGRAVAAAVASHPPAAICEVVAAARDAVDAAVGRRAARNALHVLASVAAAAPAEVARDPAGWMRARDDAASAAGWSAEGADPALLAAHVDACVSMLRAATKPGAGAPDKRLLGATLTEAMRCANELADDDADGEEDNEEDVEDDGSEDSEEDDSDDDDDAADRLEYESESEFLERYAAIARELAEKSDKGGEDDDDDEEAFDRDDDAFDRAMAPTLGDSARSVSAFRAWFCEWKAGGSSGLRTAALVDAAVAKRFEKTRGKRDE